VAAARASLELEVTRSMPYSLLIGEILTKVVDGKAGMGSGIFG
jgi:hypothetical protein